MLGAHASTFAPAVTVLLVFVTGVVPPPARVRTAAGLKGAPARGSHRYSLRSARLQFPTKTKVRSRGEQAAEAAPPSLSPSVLPALFLDPNAPTEEVQDVERNVEPGRMEENNDPISSALRIAAESGESSFLRVRWMMVEPRGCGKSDVDDSTRHNIPSKIQSVLAGIQSTRTIPEEHIFAWICPNRTKSFVAIGSVAGFESHGESRFEDARESVGYLQSRVVDAVYEGSFDAKEQKQVNRTPVWRADSEMRRSRPLVCGGFSFAASSREGGPWRGYPDSSFWIPKLTVYSTISSLEDSDNVRHGGDLRTNDTVRTEFTIAVKVEPDDTHVAVERRITGEMERIERLSKCTHDEIESLDDLMMQINFNLDGESSHRNWIDLVSRTVRNMKTNDINESRTMSKVVLARCEEYEASRPFHVGATALELMQKYPDCHTFIIKLPERPVFLGATPEILVGLSKRGGKRVIGTTALAGTRPRGSSPEADDALAQDLLSSEKDQEEHKLVVDEIRDRLRAILSKSRSMEEEGSVSSHHDEHITRLDASLKVPKRPDIRRLRNVQHLETRIEAELFCSDNRPAVDMFELLSNLHPTPALGGVPRKEALEWMSENEGWERGWFAAPVGWIDSDGNGDFVVAIRSALIEHKTAFLFSGCGIVSASDPESEWEETNDKLRAMSSALKAIRLLKKKPRRWRRRQ
mmetsp:Transcript_28523/g.69545  ORF Transcript_28523/g.69545 Transcript_28523/m.69545 type:complete len:693 (-) Transcript_28523:109-2187(-)